MVARTEPAQEARLQASLLDALGHAVIATDMTGIILYWNDAARELYGFDAKEMIGQQIYYVLPAALPDADIDRMMEGFAQGRPWDGILHVRRKDGSWVRTVHSDRVIRDASGGVIGIVSASFATETTEAALANERERYVTKDLVRALLHSLRRDGHESAARMRATGRAIARRANCPGTHVFLEVFSHMGLGDLKLDEMGPSRYVFSGVNLIERAASSPLPTCHLPLGFAEGAVEALTGRKALGAEVRCQSMGHERCTFIVSAR